MTTIAQTAGPVIGGVDTHKDVHVAAVLDSVGRLMATESFPTTRRGYRRLLGWLQGYGDVTAVGVEGCGSWGSGLARFLTAHDVRVVEVNRPNRRNRRRRGKSDTVDAEAAARAVLNGDASVIPKTGGGAVEALRQLRVARSGALKARTAAANQLHSLCDTAPDRVRAQLKGLPLKKMVAVAERWRPNEAITADNAAKRAMNTVARRWRALDDEARGLDVHIKTLLGAIAPGLLAVHGVGPGTASTGAVTARPTRRYGQSSGFAWSATHQRAPTSSGAPPKASPRPRSCDASSATSPASSSRSSKASQARPARTALSWLLDIKRRITSGIRPTVSVGEVRKAEALPLLQTELRSADRPLCNQGDRWLGGTQIGTSGLGHG